MDKPKAQPGAYCTTDLPHFRITESFSKPGVEVRQKEILLNHPPHRVERRMSNEAVGIAGNPFEVFKFYPIITYCSVYHTGDNNT